MSYVAAALLLAGSVLSFLGVLGFLRFPDLYTRLHATSKTGPLGAGLILLAVGLSAGDWVVFVRCLLGFAFLLLTTPVSAHLLARAALRSGTSPDARTSIQEYESNH